MMQKDFITLLEQTIPYTYVSVLNTPETTEYYIDLTDPEDEDELDIILSCQYAAVTANGISGVYTMYINGDIAMQATKRILNYIPASKQPAQRKAKKTVTDADRLENLIRMCSAKVISQEIEARKNHMINSAFIGLNGRTTN